MQLSQKRPFRKLMAMILTAAMVFTMTPFTVPAETAGCTHDHDAECGYIEAVPCGHDHDESCGGLSQEDSCKALGESGNSTGTPSNAEGALCDHDHDETCGDETDSCGHIHDDGCGWDEETGTGCGHEHDDSCGYTGDLLCTHDQDVDCGYIEAVPCGHVHDETCGGLSLGESGKTLGESGNPTATPTNAVIFTIDEDEYGTTALYLTESVPITDTDLLAGVAAVDENGEAVTVTVQNTGGLDPANPQRPEGPVYPPQSYTITYTAEHPETEEVFTATREAYITATPVPLAAGDVTVNGGNLSNALYSDLETAFAAINSDTGGGALYTVTINNDLSVATGGSAINTPDKATKIVGANEAVVLAFTGVGNVTVGAALTFDNITLNSTTHLYAGGYDVAFDSGVKNSGTTTCFGSVYGGGSSAGVSSSSVTIDGGCFSYVYGGGWEGAVSGNTNVTINGGTIVYSVYGGGRNAGVSGKTNITINGGTINGVYGGGGLTGATCGSTEVTVTGGTVTSGVYGGGQYGGVTGNTIVTVSGGTVGGNIYGSGASGTVDGSKSLYVKSAYKSKANNYDTLTVIDDASLVSIRGQAISAVGVGTSISSPKTANITVLNTVGSISTTDIAAATGATRALYSDSGFSQTASPINLSGTTDLYIKVTSYDTQTVLYYKVTVYQVSGITVTQDGGSVIGSSYATLDAAITAINGRSGTDSYTITLPQSITASAAITTPTKPTTIQGADDTVVLTFSGAVTAGAKLTFDNITLTGGTALYADGNEMTFGPSVKDDGTNNCFNNVYGGGYMTTVTGDTSVIVDAGKFGYVYGGGNYGGVTGNASVTINGGSISSIYGSTAEGNASTGSTSVTINGGSISGSVYGSSSVSVTGSTSVTINGGTVGSNSTNYVYGGGRGNVLGGSSVTVNGGTVWNVYGGSSSSGTVAGGTTVAIHNGTVSGSVYGGGYYTTDASYGVHTNPGNVYITDILQDKAQSGSYDSLIIIDDATLATVAAQSITASGTGSQTSPMTASISVADSVTQLVSTDIVPTQYHNSTAYATAQVFIDDTFTQAAILPLALNQGANHVYIMVAAYNTTMSNVGYNEQTYLYYDVTVNVGAAVNDITTAAVFIAAPVIGAEPQSTITAGAGYTGAISWSGSPSAFAVSTVYTATVVLTSTTGYKWPTSAPIITVAGSTSVSNYSISGGDVSGNTLTFDVTFPQTAALTQLAQVAGVTLSATGQAIWNNLSPETGLANYSVQLYKNGVSQSAAKTSAAGSGAAGVNFLTEMRVAGEGAYTVAVTSIGNGTTHSNGSESAASAAQNIVKLATPRNLAWSGGNATFDKLADETNVANYHITITGNGTVGSNTVSKTGANLSVTVSNPANGDMFKVKAMAAATGLYLDSDDATSAGYASYPYTVTYDSNGGTGMAYSVAENVGSVHTVLANTDSNLNFVRTDYDFLGWSMDSTAAAPTYTADETIGGTATAGQKITLYAIWQAVPTPVYPYTVTYDSNGGTGMAYSVAENVGSVHTVLANTDSNLNFVRTDYDFLGWSMDSTAAAPTYTAGETIGGTETAGQKITLYAIWRAVPTPASYTVTFNANGGSVSPSTMQTGADGKLFSLPTPTRSGSYSFSGWYTAPNGGTKVTTNYVFTANATVYAQWTYYGGSGNGGSSGGGSSSNRPSSASYIITTDKQLNMPKVSTVTYTGTLWDNRMTCTITNDMVQAAVNKAGTDPDGIALVFNITNSSSYICQTISIAGDALDLIKSSDVKYIQVQTDIFRFQFDNVAIESLDSQTTGVVTVIADPVALLSDAVTAVIGNRPVFEFTVKDSSGKAITSYGDGTVTCGIKYTLDSSENSGSLFVARIVDDKVQWIDKSGFDNGWMIWNGAGSAVYGVGYKTPAPSGTDTTDH